MWVGVLDFREIRVFWISGKSGVLWISRKSGVFWISGKSGVFWISGKSGVFWIFGKSGVLRPTPGISACEVGSRAMDGGYLNG